MTHGFRIDDPHRALIPALGLALALALAPCGCVRAGFDVAATPDSGSDGPGQDSSPGDAPPPDQAPRDAAPDAAPDAATDAPQNPGLKKIAAGSFTMGAPASEPCRGLGETTHTVTLTRAYEIQRTEVSQQQFAALMGYSPALSLNCGASCPVENVTWSEATACCNALSKAEGLPLCYSCSGSGASVTCTDAAAYTGAAIYTCPGYRLPTEAEWERAYRAGTQSAYYSGANDPAACGCTPVDAKLGPIGWYCGNASAPRPVGQKQANSWGLFDMAGNVAEWCHDRQTNLGAAPVTDPCGEVSGSVFRVIRGGSWFEKAGALRASARGSNIPQTARSSFVGFRCARSAP